MWKLNSRIFPLIHVYRYAYVGFRHVNSFAWTNRWLFSWQTRQVLRFVRHEESCLQVGGSNRPNVSVVEAFGPKDVITSHGPWVMDHDSKSKTKVIWLDWSTSRPSSVILPWSVVMRFYIFNEFNYHQFIEYKQDLILSEFIL